MHKLERKRKTKEKRENMKEEEEMQTWGEKKLRKIEGE
jgi:hypothetical protein